MMTKKQRWAHVLFRGKPVAGAGFSTIIKAEKWIEEREATDPKGVAAGLYTIDASAQADREYQRLFKRRK